jgi:hypothetical protein
VFILRQKVASPTKKLARRSSMEERVQGQEYETLLYMFRRILQDLWRFEEEQLPSQYVKNFDTWAWPKLLLDSIEDDRKREGIREWFHAGDLYREEEIDPDEEGHLSSVFCHIEWQDEEGSSSRRMKLTFFEQWCSNTEECGWIEVRSFSKYYTTWEIRATAVSQREGDQAYRAYKAK